MLEGISDTVMVALIGLAGGAVLGLAARLVQVANSPMYLSRFPIENCQTAIMRLGMKTTRNLVTCFAMHNIFNSEIKSLHLQIRQLWKHSCQVAAICYVLAQLHKGQLQPDKALLAGLFAFGGWHMVTFNAGETVAARKTIPRALTLGLLIVTVCYVLLNTLYFYVLPLDVVIGSDRVAADAADAIIGHGGVIMSILVVFSTFGALSGIILAGPRVYYAMARDDLFFPWFARPHHRYHTPHRDR